MSRPVCARIVLASVLLVFVLMVISDQDEMMSFISCNNNQGREMASDGVTTSDQSSFLAANAVQGSIWKASVWRKYDTTRAVFLGGYVTQTRSPPILPLATSCDHWVVVTTIFPPTELAHQVSKFPNNWCAVFVGDKKSPPANEWITLFPGKKLTFLDIMAQQSLAYRIVKLLPMNHFARKNIGYLYAIAHGAKVIYDTDDDNTLLDGGKKFVQWTSQHADAPPRTSLFQMHGKIGDHVNPYPFFQAQNENGDSMFAWPRGYALPRIMANNETAAQYNHGIETNMTVGVVQFLANHDPDVDAIHRLTRPLPMYFNAELKGLAVTPGSMSPFNAQATLFYETALWGILLPRTVHGRVSDIWRGYLVQRLMWEIDATLLFVGPVVEQFRADHHKYLADFQAELPLYLRSEQLVKFLVDWKPKLAIKSADGSTCLPALIEELFITMYEIGIIDQPDIELVQAWLMDLVEVGYVFPIPNKVRWNR